VIRECSAASHVNGVEPERDRSGDDKNCSLWFDDREPELAGEGWWRDIALAKGIYGERSGGRHVNEHERLCVLGCRIDDTSDDEATIEWGSKRRLASERAGNAGTISQTIASGTRRNTAVSLSALQPRWTITSCKTTWPAR
jgi:hypothetical protein